MGGVEDRGAESVSSGQLHAAGNRTSMSDGTGTTAYRYDALSRLTSERRTFNGLAEWDSHNYVYEIYSNLARP